MKPIVEFLLWDNCNNHCKFCFLKEHNPCPSFLTDAEKLNSIRSVIQYIDGTKFERGSSVLLCGGELFDTPLSPDTYHTFEDLMNLLVFRLQDKTIDQLYINTNLIYDINLLLMPFLVVLDSYGLLDRLHFTTSFDLVGRYKTLTDKQLFLNNIKEIKKAFPNLHIIANMVMTNYLCNLVLDDNIDILDLEEDIGVEINLIPYIILHDDLAPTSEMVMETIKHVYNSDSALKQYTNKFSINVPRILLKYYDNHLVEMTSDTSKCGHSVNFKRYSKSGDCFICDLLKLKGDK